MGPLLAVGMGLILVGLCLAAWVACRAVDPPYQGIHERGGGRHREREWEDHPEDLAA